MTEFNWKAGDEVLVVKTGVANVASMLAGLRRAGATPVLVETGDRLLRHHASLCLGSVLLVQQ